MRKRTRKEIANKLVTVITSVFTYIAAVATRRIGCVDITVGIPGTAFAITTIGSVYNKEEFYRLFSMTERKLRKEGLTRRNYHRSSTRSKALIETYQLSLPWIKLR